MARKPLLGWGLLVLLALLAGPATAQSHQDEPHTLTFEDCRRAGGVGWGVDLNHPDICPACADYLACKARVDDYREVCPECYGACPECRARYTLYENCPQCYGPCQACENRYLNDFADQAERFQRCPVCQTCASCREALAVQYANCPPCVSCEQCRAENRRYTDIRAVCPQVIACDRCRRETGPYPGQCPDGRRRIGIITDAAIPFQCCR